MEVGSGLDQLLFLTLRDFSFINRKLCLDDIPEKIKKTNDAVKIMSYNNQNQGMITNDFFVWALKNDISYKTMIWYIKDFSNQSDYELLNLVDSLFNHYTFYLDESNNCGKFRFKNAEGVTNVKWYNDFVLSGVVFEGDSASFMVEDLFDKFKFQSNNTDAKLKNIAKYNGEDPNRFVDILKSNKVSVLLETLFHSKGVYIHWETENLLYYSLVDIVDSVIDEPYLLDMTKNVLYNYAEHNEDDLFNMLAYYEYPNIKDEQISDFCEQFLIWLESLEAQSYEEIIALNLLHEGMTSSLRTNDLLFLQNNKDRLLIEDFVPLYAQRVAAFPNSVLHFDKCGLVENKMQLCIKAFCGHKVPYYDFINSEDNKWIQLSDMIAGIHGALMSYVNTHDIPNIRKDLLHLNEIQNHNLYLLMSLRKKSYRKNIHFDRMSKNVRQKERLHFLRDYFDL